MIVMVITIAMVGHGRGMRWLRLHYDTKSPLLHIHILVTTTMYCILYIILLLLLIITVSIVLIA